MKSSLTLRLKENEKAIIALANRLFTEITSSLNIKNAVNRTIWDSMRNKLNFLKSVENKIH
jgi:hypothetical protein